MTEQHISKYIGQIDIVVNANDELSLCYKDFMKVLAKEEESIIEHNIEQYELVGKQKETFAAKILDAYQSLSSACETICEMARRSHIKDASIEKLSDMANVLDSIAKETVLSETSKKVFLLQIEKAKKSILDVVEIQKESKEYVERNVMLVSKLLNNHRQSYQFWRESIASEAVGYNDRGVRKPTSQSVSMFNARA